MISFSTISFIFLLNFLLFATKAHCGATKTKHPKQVDATANCSYFNYKCFAMSIGNLSRACSIRLLTNNAMVVIVQQNIHAILKLLLGEYQLGKDFLEDARAFRNKRLRVQGKSYLDAIEIIDETFIGYDMGLNCLIVARSVWNYQRGACNLEYFPVKGQLPPVGVLYSKMIAEGIDLHFVLRLFPRIIDLYEADFKMKAPDSPKLSNLLNGLVKEFICKHFKPKNGKMKNPPSSLMKRLAKEFFKNNLDAQLYTIRQGHMEQLYAHIISKPCAVYEDKVFIGMGYLKDSIKFIEKCKLPTCPSSAQMFFENNICYCIRTYDSEKCNKTEIVNSKKYEQNRAASLLTTAIPLMRVPEGTALVTFIFFSKKSLSSFLAKKQKADGKKVKCSDKDQSNDDSSQASFPSTMISDEQLHIFMTHFAAYLYTNENKYLQERNNK